MSSITKQNRLLVQHYGTTDDGRAWFRIVWSDSTTEKRMGTFREFVGKLFIREETKMAERKKYPWVKERWVLEKLIFPPAPYCYEIDICNGSYENIWTFEGANGQYVPPVWENVKRICHAALHGPGRKQTLSEIEQIEEEKFQKTLQEDYEILDNETPYLPGLLNTGSAIVVPRGYEK